MKLEVSGLRSGYRQGVDVVLGAEFTASTGAVGFIGRNGAGKTCLAQTLSGAIKATAGTVTLDGVDITGQGSRERVRSGISLVPEGRLVFGQLSVRENLEVAAFAAGKRGERLSRIEERFPILREKRDRPAASMSGGEQQLLAIGRAIIQEPALIILDEPSLGLSPIAVDNLTESLRGIVQDYEVTLILMEQNGELLTGLCDEVILMDDGEFVRSLDMSKDEDQQALEASYLGL
ncbi:ABC transporter ATP-binding protein [Pseudonocardia halophobica]|uniref:ABC transporter ATP-binding protein n=1 Tax=Pseudonocardia halophobica TaxID=29401 RepID=A0A9W6L022_9PSEU|nr:ATP-binding cassette domain-containing protein [Pseudonocardia halophobica]GLL09769.1 ABC transporter ATP-binding protein [Pseudonocardia halophobica]